MSRFDSEGTSPVTKTYASIGADLDLRDENPTGSQPPRWIRIGSSGSLALEYSGGHTDTTPVLPDGEIFVAGPITLLAATTATDITVFW